MGMDGLEHWGARFVRESTRVRKSTTEEKEARAEKIALREQAYIAKSKGKYKGKGKGKGKDFGMMVRDEVAEAIRATLSEVDRRKSEGMLVVGFSEAVAKASDRTSYDELIQICLARVCVASGAFVIMDEIGGGGPSTVATRTAAKVAAEEDVGH